MKKKQVLSAYFHQYTEYISCNIFDSTITFESFHQVILKVLFVAQVMPIGVTLFIFLFRGLYYII